MLHASKMYGYTVGETSFDWGKLKEMRDAYVRRLNGIYHRNVEKSGVTLVYGVRSLSLSLSLCRVVCCWRTRQVGISILRW